jgi:hypothetical protein
MNYNYFQVVRRPKVPKEVFTKKKYVIPETPETKYVWKTIDVDDANVEEVESQEPPVT